MNPDHQTFLSNLEAAVAAGAPVEVGQCDQKMDRLTRKRMKSAEALLENSPRTRAALEVFQKTGSMGVVLDSLCVRTHAIARMVHLFRKTFVYLVVLTLVAIAGMVIFRQRMLPEIRAMHHDLLTLARVNLPEGHSNGVVADSFGVGTIVFIAFLVLLLLWLLLGGITRSAMWLGGKDYLRFRSLSVAVGSLRLLLASGVAEEQAIVLSSDLAALDDEGKAELVTALKGSGGHPANLSEWNQFLRIASQRSWLKLKQWGAFVVVGVIGGSIALTYCLIVFWPMVSLMFDLALRGRA